MSGFATSIAQALMPRMPQMGGGTALHQQADHLTDVAHSAMLAGQPANHLLNLAKQLHSQAGSFGQPSMSPPIHERVTPHLIHTDIHTGIRSPGVSGVNPVNPPQQSGNASDIVGGGAQSALSSL